MNVEYVVQEYFNMQEVKKTSPRQNFYFNIVSYIKSNSKLPKYATLGFKSKQALNYYIQDLKKAGFINKLGYGTWEVLKDFNILDLKKSKKINLGNPKELNNLKEVRGHAFMFKLRIPSIRNWGNLPTFLMEHNIKDKPLKYGHAILFRGRKVHLFKESIIIYEKESYIADVAKDTKSYAIYEFLKLVQALETLFKVSFKINKTYKFRICREHYALLKNCLARQYDKENKRLYVYSDKGLWFIIDNSYNLHEAETVLLNEAVTDNEGIQDYFNSHKATRFKVTPEFILNCFNESNNQIIALIQDRKYWAENQKTHVAAIQELAQGVKKNTEGINEFVALIKQLKKP